MTREPPGDKGAVEAGQRHDVGHGRQRDQIERRDQVGGLAPIPETGLPERPIERDQRHIDDAGGGEMAKAGKIVLAVGIDQRQRLRQRFGRLVMIEHDHVEAEPFGVSEGLVADRAAIDGDDEPRAFCREAGDRLGVGAIAFRNPIGDVHDCLAAAGGEKFA